MGSMCAGEGGCMSVVWLWFVCVGGGGGGIREGGESGGVGGG